MSQPFDFNREFPGFEEVVSHDLLLAFIFIQLTKRGPNGFVASYSR